MNQQTLQTQSNKKNNVEQKFITKVETLFENNNIVITSDDHFGSMFLRKNIHALFISLSSNGEYGDVDCNQYLIGKVYDIIIGCATVYRSTIFFSNIFPVVDVPLHLLAYHDVKIIIYDVELPINNNYLLSVTLHESDKIYDHNDEFMGQNIKWYPYYENIFDMNDTRHMNTLRFLCGMAGCFRSYLKFPKSYIEQSGVKTEFIIGNKIKMVHINHLNNEYQLTQFGKYFNDCYSLSRSLAYLVDNRYDILSETTKCTYNIKNNCVKINHCNGDMIGNVKIMCDPEAIKISEIKSVNIKNNLTIVKEKYGYSILELSGTKCLNKLSINLSNVYFEIKIKENTLNKQTLDVIYDRILCDAPFRKKLALMNSNSTIITNIEAKIIDIMSLLPI